MRPEALFSLFKPVTSLKGIGPRIAKLVEKAAGPNRVDLCWHLPSAIIDRRYAPLVADALPGVVATMTLTVDRHQKPPNKRLPYKVYCSDDTGKIALVFFHAHEDYLRKTLPEGEVRVVSGKIEKFGNEIQITHPDHIGTAEEISRLKAVEPVYPLTTGLTLKVLGKAIRATLDELPALEEWIDPAYLKKQGWAGWRDAVLEAHSPEDEKDLEGVMIKASKMVSSGSSRRDIVAKLNVPTTRNTTINARMIDRCVSAKCGKFIATPR